MTESDARFLVITPTIGRPTLKVAALSALSQFGPWDRMIIVADGFVSGASDLARTLGVSFDQTPHTGRWGNAQRNLILGRLEYEGHEFIAPCHPGFTHLIFLDDDDIILPQALQAVRRTIGGHPSDLILCRFMTDYRVIVWQVQEIKQGNVGTGGIVCPTSGRLGRYGDRYEGDYDFIAGTLGLRNQAPVWSPLFLQMCRPDFNHQPDRFKHDQMLTLNERLAF